MISLDNESKSKVSLAKESKADELTFDDAGWSWDKADSRWNAPKRSLSNESKSLISLSNESK